MRRSDRLPALAVLALLVVVLAAGGCSVRLDKLPAASSSTDGGAPTVEGCRLFHPRSAATPGVTGRVSSVAMPDGRTLWIVGSLHTASGNVTSAGAWVATTAQVDTCLSGAGWVGGAPRSVLAPSPLGADMTLAALAPVRAGSDAYLYYALSRPAPGEPFGTHLMGYGIARWDAASERFVPTSTLLWTGDRPDYGSAVVVDGATAYVYGCKNSGFLRDDCYVARAPVNRLDDSRAYEYSTSGGNWSAQPDDAWPVVTGVGDPVSVMRDAARHHYVMVYVPPLGDTLAVRSGLGPDGPWSAPFDVARCALPDKDAFCGSLALHPELAARIPPGSVAASYAISTFTPGAADAAPEAYWSRLVTLPLPRELP